MKYYCRNNSKWTLSESYYDNPISDFWRFTGDVQVRRTKEDGKFEYVTLPVDKYRAALESVYQAAVAPDIGNLRKAMQFTGDINTVALPQIFSYTGDFLPVEPPYKVDFPSIEVNNQPRYADSKAKPSDGDIVVSPYQTGYLRITPGPNYFVTSRGSEGQRGLPGHIVLGIPAPTMSSPVIIGGLSFTRLPICMLKFEIQNVEEKPGNNEVDHGFLMNAIISGCHPTSVVTEVVADANRRTVDLLTTLAETPQTAKSALRGVMTILQMYKDARNREFRLRDQVKRINVKWNKEISRLENLSKREDAAIKRANLQWNKDVNKTLHAIASVWLTYRLEILPTAIAVDGILKQVQSKDHMVQFLRFRGNDTYTVPYNGNPIPYEFRAFVKRSVVPGKELSAYYSFNPLTTLWELGWLTFVVDRFVNIGDFLTANFNNPGTYVHKEGSTFSWSVKTSITVRDAKVDIDFYKRSVFSSDSYCPLQYPKSRSMKQSADHLALAWAIFSKRL